MVFTSLSCATILLLSRNATQIAVLCSLICRVILVVNSVRDFGLGRPTKSNSFLPNADVFLRDAHEGRPVLWITLEALAFTKKRCRGCPLIGFCRFRQRRLAANVLRDRLARQRQDFFDNRNASLKIVLLAEYFVAVLCPQRAIANLLNVQGFRDRARLRRAARPRGAG